MYLYFSLATLYDYDLNNSEQALINYVEYKKSLLTHLENIKLNKDSDSIEIREIEYKLKNLETHIERLNKKIMN